MPTTAGDGGRQERAIPTTFRSWLVPAGNVQQSVVHIDVQTAIGASFFKDHLLARVNRGIVDVDPATDSMLGRCLQIDVDVVEDIDIVINSVKPPCTNRDRPLDQTRRHC